MTLSSDVSVDWFLRRPGVEDLRFCYDSEITQDLTEKYSLRTLTDGHELIIRNMTVADSGTYICKWSKYDKQTFPVIAIIKSPTTVPTSSANGHSDDVTGSVNLFVFYLFLLFRSDIYLICIRKI